MKRRYVWVMLVWVLAGCAATPPSMMAQRSQLVLENKKGLLISNSKTFEEPESQFESGNILYHQHFVLQNTNLEPIEIYFQKAVAEWLKNSRELNCRRSETQSQASQIMSNEKVMIKCTLTIKRSESWSQDELILFKIPTSLGVNVEAKKLIRAGDFL